MSQSYVDKRELYDTLVARMEGLSPFADADQLLPLLREAITLVDKEERPLAWAGLHAKLGYTLPWAVTGERGQNIDEAIACWQQTLSVITVKEHPDMWAQGQLRLGELYEGRLSGNSSENQETARRHYQEGLQVAVTLDRPDLQHALHWGLGGSYAQVINPNEEIGEKAIYHLQKAVELSPVANAGSLPYIQFAPALFYRQRPQGNPADNLEEALRLMGTAVAQLASGPPGGSLAEGYNKLGEMYLHRVHGDIAENIELAIAHLNNARQIYEQLGQRQDVAMVQNNLRAAYMKRVHGHFDENQELAIQAANAALAVYTRQKNPQEWARARVQLGSALWQRVQGDREANITEAISCYQDALRVRTFAEMPDEYALTHFNLASIYAEMRTGDRQAHLDQAVTSCQEALRVYTPASYPAQWAGTQGKLATLALERWRAGKADAASVLENHARQALAYYRQADNPVECRRILQTLSDYYLETQAWPQAAHSLQEAIQAGQAVLKMAHTKEGWREAVWAIAHFYPMLAYALLKLEGWSEAFLRLDQGKSQLLRLTFSSPGTTAKGMSAMDLVDLLSLAPAEGALVVPLLTPWGSAVFILPYGQQEITADHVLWLPQLRQEDALTWLRGDVASGELGGWLRAMAFRNSEPAAWRETIATTGERMWPALLEPIHERLQTMGLSQGAPLIFIPPGNLGALPLHAAWRLVAEETRYFLDDYTLTFAPGAYALHLSQGRRQAQTAVQPSLVAVLNPTCDLPHAAFEGTAVAALFPAENQTLLRGDEATKTAVLQAAPGCTYLHLVTHGAYDWRNPGQSGLILGQGESLSLEAVTRDLNLEGVRLVTLSACETGLTELFQLPEEYLGFAAGFLQVGATVVISTLWEVNDLSTMLLMERFYRLHLQDGLGLAEALRLAQLWLREVTAEELANHFAAARAKFKGNQAIVTAVSSYWRCFVVMEPGKRPFSHPYYWAAFTFTGA